jgi:GNAT superfamily N-acetyltransferase
MSGTWDADNRRLFDESFAAETWSLILVDGVRAGVMAVDDRPAEIFLSRIYLLPEFQQKGIGTTLMGQLIERAKAARKPLRLRVLRVNPARSLYERLGFSVTESTPDRHYMEYRP